MGGPACAAILQGIVNLEDEGLVTPHQREPVPAVLRIVGDRIGLADAIGIATLRYHEVTRRHAARIADGERKGLDRMADRPPDLHDREPSLQELIRLLWQQITHPLRPRPFRVVVVHALDDFPDLARLTILLVGGAQRMVEHDHAGRPALGLHQRFHLRVIDPTHLVLVVEIDDLGVVANEMEAVAIEREALSVEPPVVHEHTVRIARAGRTHHGRARTASKDRGHLAGIEQIIERRLDCRRRDIWCGGRNHGELLVSDDLPFHPQHKDLDRPAQPAHWRRGPFLVPISHGGALRRRGSIGGANCACAANRRHPKLAAKSCCGRAGRENAMLRLVGLFVAALCCACAAPDAFAQAGYPNKAIRILVPYAPGGLTDVVARHYAEQLRKDLGQNVIIENKPGASGIIAIEAMARSRPDGYTIMVGNISTNGLTPILLSKIMPVDYEKDVQIVARLADTPVFFMSTTHNFPPTTFAEFIAYAKAHPGAIRYASAGVGAYQHVNTEILAKRAGISLLHIPYKDGGPGILKDLANGDIQVSWFNIANPVGMMKAGHVRPLAISAAQRLPAYPDVPTIDEVGFPGMRATQWTAAFAPAKTPREIVEALHKAFVQASNSPTLQEAFEKGGMMVPRQSSVEDAQAWLKDEMANLAKDIKDANIVVDP